MKKTFILFIMILLFSCKEDKYRDELLFIQEIINNPENLENIIKTSRYYQDTITKIDYKFIYDFLIENPYKNLKYEIEIYEGDEPNDIGLYPLTFYINDGTNESSTFCFVFVKILNGEYKLRWIVFYISS